MLRKISLSLRRIQGKKETKKTLITFRKWQQQLHTLPPPATTHKKLLIIRLDDIGDYLLFRNTLPAYRQAPQLQGYHITLLANAAWRSLYEYADPQAADNVIWVNKNEYFDNPDTRTTLWQTLRAQGFHTVICPARTRPLLLDDICMIAAAAPHTIATNNTLSLTALNPVSNKLYTTLYHNDTLEHEFLHNLWLARTITGAPLRLTAPHITPPPVTTGITAPYIICFIGGSKKSHQWPATHWIELINTTRTHTSYTFVIAGGKADAPMADTIVAATGAHNITAQATLPQVAGWMAQAAAVISNDTMAAHLAVSCATPTLIVANGDNFYRFCDYPTAGIPHTQCVYPPLFLHQWRRHHHKPFTNYIAVTKDITTITPQKVKAALLQLLKK